MTDFKAGDLVIVVRVDHKCASKLIGKVFTIRGMNLLGVRCPGCGERDIQPYGTPTVIYGVHEGTELGMPPRWLRKIPPLSKEKEREVLSWEKV